MKKESKRLKWKRKENAQSGKGKTTYLRNERSSQ